MRYTLTLLLFLLSTNVHAQTVTQASIAGKWSIESIEMGPMGVLPASKGDHFKFEKGIATIVSMGEVSEPAPYVIEGNNIVVTHSNKIEKLNVIELSDTQIKFILDLYINEKKMSAGNIIFTLTR